MTKHKKNLQIEPSDLLSCNVSPKIFFAASLITSFWWFEKEERFSSVVKLFSSRLSYLYVNKTFPNKNWNFWKAKNGCV